MAASKQQKIHLWVFHKSFRSGMTWAGCGGSVQRREQKWPRLLWWKVWTSLSAAVLDLDFQLELLNQQEESSALTLKHTRSCAQAVHTADCLLECGIERNCAFIPRREEGTSVSAEHCLWAAAEQMCRQTGAWIHHWWGYASSKLQLKWRYLRSKGFHNEDQATY